MNLYYTVNTCFRIHRTVVLNFKTNHHDKKLGAVGGGDLSGDVQTRLQIRQ